MDRILGLPDFNAVNGSASMATKKACYDWPRHLSWGSCRKLVIASGYQEAVQLR